MTGHVVQRVAFDFEVATHTEALATQDKLTGFRLNRLDGILDECFAEAVEDARHLRFDRLEIDLGDLPADGMEAVLAQRLRAALRDALRRAGARTEPTTMQSGLPTTPEKDDLEALAFYLQYGMSHWTHHTKTVTLEELLASAIADSPQRLRLLLRRLGVDASVRRRLALQASEQTVARLVDVLGGTEDESLAHISASLRHIHRAFPVTRESRDAFAAMVRAALLETLLGQPFAEDSDARAETKLLQHLARATGIASDELLDGLRDRARLLPNVDKALRNALDAAATARLSRVEPGQRPSEGDAGILVDVFLARLTGTDAPGLSSAPSSERAYQDALSRLRPVLAKSLELRRRLAARLRAGELARVVKALHPDAESLLRAASRVDPMLRDREAALGRRQAQLAENLLALASQHVIGSFDESDIVDRLAQTLDRAQGARASGTAMEPASVPGSGDIAPLAGTTTAPAGMPGPDSLETFLFLLRHGTAPASDAAFATRDMAVWVDELLAEDEPRLLTALRTIGEHPATVTNMLRHLPWSTLETLVVRLAPEIGGLVATALLATELAVTELPPARGLAVRRAAWRTALGFVLDPHMSRPTARSFLASMVRGVSDRTGTSRSEMLALLLSGARPGDTRVMTQRHRFAPFVEILYSIRDEFPTDRRGPVSRVAGADIPTGQPDAKQRPRSPITAPEAPTAATSTAIHAPPTEDAGSSPFDEAPVSPEAEAARQGIATALHAFLRYGALPPGDAGLASIEADLVASLREGDSTLRDYLRAATRARLPRARLVRCLTPATLRSVLQHICPAALELLPALDTLAQMLASLVRGMTAAEWEPLVVDELLVGVGEAAAGARFEAHAVVRAVLQRASQRSRRPYPVLLAALSVLAEQGSGRAIVQLRTLLGRLADTAWAETAAPALEGKEETPAESREVAVVDFITYVDNAGLVLLWPFLTRYFTILDLLRDNRFRSAAAQLRAVHLTQFLATGERDTPEHRVTLNKLLCGLPPAVPVDLGFLPTDEEIELSEDLLRGVTQSWPPLRNTSIQGLRETFLCREGRLSRDVSEAPLILHVDSKAYDMLLDQLPWSISVIRLSFMTEALHVKWR